MKPPQKPTYQLALLKNGVIVDRSLAWGDEWRGTKCVRQFMGRIANLHNRKA